MVVIYIMIALHSRAEGRDGEVHLDLQDGVASLFSTSSIIHCGFTYWHMKNDCEMI